MCRSGAHSLTAILYIAICLSDFARGPTTARILLILKRRRILSSFEFAAQSRGSFFLGVLSMASPCAPFTAVMRSGYAVDIKQVREGA